MNRRTRIIFGIVASLAMVATFLPAPQSSALSIVPPNQGQLIGVCWNNAVHLFWGTHPDANSNSLQKGDMYPNDPNNFWGWVVQGHPANSYVDHAITQGITYTYRVKYAPELPSNEVTVVCPVVYPTPYPTPHPTPYPTPGPHPSLECRPNYQRVDSGDRITFRAERGYSSTYPYQQLTWRAVGGNPSSGTGTTFDTRFYTNSIRETRRVTVSDGYRTATCTVRVEREERVEDLRISPTRRTIDSGERITFRATGGTGSYRWSAPDVVSYTDSGSWWNLRFDNDRSYTRSFTVTLRSGSQRETAVIRVRPRYSPTPTPYGGLQCYPPSVSVTSGEEVILRAWGGNGQYTWTNVSSYPRTAYGANYSTRFTNNTGYLRTFIVRVTSGWETSICQIHVAPYRAYPPTPYPTPYSTPYPTPYPTPYVTPTPYGPEDINLSQGARNISRGDIALTSSVRAKGNDTVQFSLVVRNTSDNTLRNVRVTDILPSGLQYIWGSTTIDGTVIGDGITSSGIHLGSLGVGHSKTIGFSVMIDSLQVPAYGTRTVYNTAQVRADNTDTEISRLAVHLGVNGVLGTAAIVQTGTGDTALIALAVAMAATGLYALYAGSALFERRYAQTGLRKHLRDKNRLNFARLLK